MVIAVTGHRPQHMDLRPSEYAKFEEFAVLCLTEIQPSKIITGMALGWDTVIAKACVRKRIPFIAALPCRGQELVWSGSAQHTYWELVHKAEEIVWVTDGPYDDRCMKLRDEWMVDHCESVLALFSGKPGGTAHTVAYAWKKRKVVHNVWDNWELKRRFR